jgi:hypothetical protein
LSNRKVAVKELLHTDPAIVQQFERKRNFLRPSPTLPCPKPLTGSNSSELTDITLSWSSLTA